MAHQGRRQEVPEVSAMRETPMVLRAPEATTNKRWPQSIRGAIKPKKLTLNDQGAVNTTRER